MVDTDAPVFKLQDVSLELRADIKQCFDKLSVKLLEDIRDLLSNHASTSSVRREMTASDEDDSRQAKKGAFAISIAEVKPSHQPLPVRSSWHHSCDDRLERSSAMTNQAPGNTTTTTSTGEMGSHSGCKKTHQVNKVATAIEELNATSVLTESMTPVWTSLVDKVILRDEKQEVARGRTLYRLVDSTAFASLSALLIVANSIWMGYEADTRPTDGGLQDWDWYAWVDLSFTVWFCLELVLKVIALRKDFIFGHDANWNLLDGILVGCSIPDLFMRSGDVTSFRVFRIFRQVRVLRAARLLEAFGTLREIWVTVWFTFSALMWCVVAIIMVAYVFAILIGNSIKTEAAVRDVEFSTETQENFATLFRSMLALFSLISGGQEWFGFMEDFISNDMYFAQLALLCWMVFMTFGFMNIVIAIFCGSIAEASQQHCGLRTAKQSEAHSKRIEDLTRIFRMMDTTRRGVIYREEFLNFAAGSGEYAMLQFHGLQPHVLRPFWDSLNNIDPSTSGVDVKAFVTGFIRLSTDCQHVDMLLQLKFEELHTEIRERLKEQQLCINEILRLQM